MSSFNAISRRYTTHHKLLAQEKISKVANWIIVDILKYLY